MDGIASSFSLFKMSPSPVPGDQPPASNPPSGAPSGGVANAATSAATEEVKQHLADPNRKKRSYTRRDKADGGLTQSALQNEVNAQIASQLEACYDQKLCAALASMPAVVAKALTGNDERWTLEKEESETLGAATSAALRTLMITNPRALAISMAVSAFMMVYAPRAMAQLEEMAKKKKATAEQEKK